MMRKFAASLIVIGTAAMLTACAKGPTTLTAVRTLEDSDNGARVTLTLNQLDPKNDAGGDGTLQVSKPAGSQNATPEGTYPVTWKWFTDDGSISVSVPDAHDAFMLKPRPDEIPEQRHADIFWCMDCEENRHGNIGMLPGVFVKKE